MSRVGDVRRGEMTVVAIAWGIVGFTLAFNLSLARVSGGMQPAQLARIFVAAAIAHSLYSGRSWARWLTVALGTVAVVIGLANVGRLPTMVGLMPWLLLVATAFYGGAVLILALDPSVETFFQSRRATPHERHTGEVGTGYGDRDATPPAQVPCPYCEEWVSATADECPRCGGPMTDDDLEPPTS